MKQPIITIIGAGNMGSSIIGGLIKNGHPENNLWVSDPSELKLNQLLETFRLQTTTDNLKAIQQADVVIFAIKPQVFKRVVSNLSGTLTSHKPLIISVAAGIRESNIAHWLQNKQIAVVRAMPNTPALIGCGATALYGNAFVSKEQRQLTEKILGAVGLVTWLANEQLMDIVTALSGSGPAYFFLVMESLQLAAEQLGLDNTTARLLTLQTALGAARMAIESGKSLTELRYQVTSPGGTTEEAISVLENHHIRDIFTKALQAAQLRSKELSELTENT